MAATEKRSAKNKESLTKVLVEYYHSSVETSRKSLKYHQKIILNRTLNPILAEIGKYDTRFQVEPVDALSCYVGVPNDRLHNFDVLVPLPNFAAGIGLNHEDSLIHRPTSAFVHSFSCDNPYVNKLLGYGYFLVNSVASFCHDFFHDQQDEVTSEQCLEFSSFICPIKFMNYFEKLVSRAVANLEDNLWWEEEPTVFEVKVELKGPSVALTVHMIGETFNISLLPVIPLTQGWPESLKGWGPKIAVRPNPWLTSPKMRNIMDNFCIFPAPVPPNEDPRLWAVCFYQSEASLCSLVKGGCEDTCRKETLDILMYFVEENASLFYPITARMIRVIFLHQCVQFPHDEDWFSRKLGRAFVDMLSEIVNVLKSGVCPHFFMSDQNLLARYDKKDLRPVARHLKAVLNDIIENPGRTKFLPRKLSKYENI